MNTIDVMKQWLDALIKYAPFTGEPDADSAISSLRAAIEAAESKGCKECDGTGYDYVGEIRVWCPVCNNPNTHPAPVPEGWQLVPVKVTPEIEAVYANDHGAYGTAQELHDAMLAAAPKEGK